MPASSALPCSVHHLPGVAVDPRKRKVPGNDPAVDLAFGRELLTTSPQSCSASTRTTEDAGFDVNLHFGELDT